MRALKILLSATIHISQGIDFFMGKFFSLKWLGKSQNLSEETSIDSKCSVFFLEKWNEYLVWKNIYS